MGDWEAGEAAPLDTNEQRLAITEIIYHPDYNHTLNGYPLEYDIAVIKVSGTFECRTDAIYPACLPIPEVTALIIFYLLRLFI